VDEVAAIRQGRIKNFFSRAEAVGYPRTSRAEATQFRLLFRLLPVLPPTLRRAVVALRLYQPLGHLPPALAQLAEMVLGALSSERKASLYGAQLRHDLRRGLRDWLVTAHQRPSHADVEVAPASARPARRLLVGLRRLRQPADRRGENDRT